MPDTSNVTLLQVHMARKKAEEAIAAALLEFWDVTGIAPHEVAIEASATSVSFVGEDRPRVVGPRHVDVRIPLRF
jgi:hypothetical protein